MSLHPVNDNLMVEIGETSPFAGANEQQGVETGIVVEIPSFIPYLGFHSFAFENSIGEYDGNEKLIKRYNLVGKRVYWTAYTERGSVLKDGDKTYAFLKLTDLIAVEDDKKAKPAKSIETAQGGGIALN